MACDRMRELAFLSIDGELTESERADLAAHVATCADCRAAQAAAARVASGLRGLAPPPVPAGFSERTLKRLAPPARPLARLTPYFALAATLVAAAVFLVELRRGERPNETMVASEHKAPPAGERTGRLDSSAAPREPPAPSGAAGAPVGGNVSDEEIDVVATLATLAEGSPADALRRIGDLPRLRGLQDDVERSVKEDRDEWLGKREGERKDAASRDDGADAENEKTRRVLGDRGKAAAPTLRFARVTGDPKRFDELLAPSGKRDGAGRAVVDLGQAEIESLRARLDAAGLKLAEMPSAEWLRAARSTAIEEGMLAGKGAPKPAAAPPASSPAGSDADKSSLEETRKKAEEVSQSKETGRSAPAEPPRRRERWFILLGPR